MSIDIKAKLEIDKIQKEIEKLDVEKEKIRLETIELGKGFYKKPQWWAFFASFIISLFTFITLWANGTFNAIKNKTEAEFAVLKLEKTRFEIDKNNLDTLIKQKTDSLSIVTDSINKLISVNKFLIKENFDLTNIRIQLESGIRSKNEIVYNMLDSIKSLNSKILINRPKVDTAKMVSERIPNNSFAKVEPVNLVSVFPNPFLDILNLSIKGSTSVESMTVEIYDLVNKIVYQESFVRTQQALVKQFNLSKFPRGVYFVKVYFSNTSTTIKIIKQ